MKWIYIRAVEVWPSFLYLDQIFDFRFYETMNWRINNFPNPKNQSLESLGNQNYVCGDRDVVRLTYLRQNNWKIALSCISKRKFTG